MRSKKTSLFLCILMVATVLSALSVNTARDVALEDTGMSINTESDVEPEEIDIQDTLSKIHGYFTENRGQIEDEAVKYYTQGGEVWLLDDGVMFDIKETQQTENIPNHHDMDTKFPEDVDTTISCKGVVIKLNFEGANDIEPAGKSPLLHYGNFFYGDDPSKWRREVPHYNEIIYPDVYDNIDLSFMMVEKGVKYEFIIHPGGNPGDIRLRYEGIEELRINISGDLDIHTEIGVITDSGLNIYQADEETQKEVEGRFKIFDSMTYGFDVSDDYDKESDLVIDPYALIWSTFVGGNNFEIGEDIALGVQKTLFVTGTTSSPDFPSELGSYDNILNGTTDVFVFALDEPSGGALQGSTFIGGEDTDYGTSIAVDSDDNVYVTGYTYSTDFPKTYLNAYDPTLNGSCDVFVLRLDWWGSSLLYSSYFGGEKSDKGFDLLLYRGLVYVTGSTNSSDFPTKLAYDSSFNGKRDVFLFKVNVLAIGFASLMYSTYVGGSEDDVGYSIANGYWSFFDNPCVTGKTNSSDFPIGGNYYDPSPNGEYDAFVFVLVQQNISANLSLEFSTYIGGAGNESGQCIRSIQLPLVVVAGYTFSSNFPNTTNAFDPIYNGGGDAFVFEMDTFTGNLSYSSFVGGSGNDEGYSLVIGDDPSGWWVTGQTNSVDFPITNITYNGSLNGKLDVFVFRLNCTELQFSTYVGGGKNDTGKSIEYRDGYVYVTGITYSPNFHTTLNAYDKLFNGSCDVFVFKGFDLYWVLDPAFFDFSVSIIDLSDIIDRFTVYIELSGGLDIHEVNTSGVRIPRIGRYPVNLPAINNSGQLGDYDKDGIPDLSVDFDGKALITLLLSLVTPPAYVELAVCGEFYNGTHFEGSKTILVIDERTLKITPNTLNLKSKGRWISCRIELPDGVDVDDFNISTVRISYINGKPVDIPAADHLRGGDDILILKFDRAEVEDNADPGEIKITISGELLDGRPFGAHDTINVIG